MFNLEDCTGAIVATARIHNVCIDLGEHEYDRERDMDDWEQY